MLSKPGTVKVELNLVESGTICHQLLQAMLVAGGTANVPKWYVELYNKMCEVNDYIRFGERDEAT